MTKTAVVVGGSLAGLMHAIMLRDNGYTVTVLEQEPAAHRQGLDAGIRVGSDYIRFFEKHDRTKREYGILATSGITLSKEGTVKMKMSFQATLTSWGLVWSILRANFDAQASKAVPDPPPPLEGSPKVEYRCGMRVTDVREASDKVHIQFEDLGHNATEVIEADLVIAADGCMSPIRKIVAPKVKSEYVGYVTWRGTLQENLLDKEAVELLEEKVVVHHVYHGHFVIYVIPTDDGDLPPGKRIINWVWYHELAPDSPEMRETMTDIHGKLHQGTVPRELLRPDVWEKQKALAASVAPALINQMLQRTKSPFVTKLYESASPQAVFMGGKLLLVGDALAKFRPHAALSTNQAALQSLALEEVLNGRMTMKQWEKKVLVYGHSIFLWSRVLGNFQQGYRLALLWSILGFIVAFVGLRIGVLPWA